MLAAKLNLHLQSMQSDLANDVIATLRALNGGSVCACVHVCLNYCTHQNSTTLPGLPMHLPSDGVQQCLQCVTTTGQ